MSQNSWVVNILQSTHLAAEVAPINFAVFSLLTDFICARPNQVSTRASFVAFQICAGAKFFRTTLDGTGVLRAISCFTFFLGTLSALSPITIVCVAFVCTITSRYFATKLQETHGPGG